MSESFTRASGRGRKIASKIMIVRQISAPGPTFAIPECDTCTGSPPGSRWTCFRPHRTALGLEAMARPCSLTDGEAQSMEAHHRWKQVAESSCEALVKPVALRHAQRDWRQCPVPGRPHGRRA